MVDMHPLQAYKFLRSEADAVLVDVRSELEYFFVGHAEGALHIPWHVESGTEVNLNFIESLLKFVGSRERPVVLICRNGDRSKEAALHAEKHQFTRIYNVLYGFEGNMDHINRRNQLNGWRYDGLPWEQC